MIKLNSFNCNNSENKKRSKYTKRTLNSEINQIHNKKNLN